LIDIEALTQALKNGSRQAFDSLYHYYFPQLYAYSLKCSKRTELAEEIVQETFVQLWLSRASIRETDKLDRLLIVIAHHKLLNAIRRTANAPAFADYVDYENALSTPSSGDQAIEYEEFLVLLHRALDTLPETQRRVVELSRLEGMKTADIARTLDRSEQTVRNQLSLGLKALYAKLKGRVPLWALLLLLG
jgi:RNA polymerase sigma-70 factor (family 1)